MAAAPAHLLAPGEVFHEHYEIVRCIGAGGMGAVYEVRHLETGGHLALKVMLPKLVAQEPLRQRFRQEAQVLARIRSDHLVQVNHAGVDQSTGVPFMILELLEGEPLEDTVQRQGRLAPADALLYLRQTGFVLSKTHAEGIVHRDLKPDNMFLTTRDDGSKCIKLLDFGVAKLVQDGSGGTTDTVGTPTYMAPEQIQGAGEEIGPCTDLYALAHVAYTLLVGEPYYEPERTKSGAAELLLTIAFTGLSEPASQRARQRKQVELPAAFDGWFAKAVALEPTGRFADVRKMIDELAGVLAPMLRSPVKPTIEPEQHGPPSDTLSRWLNEPSSADGSELGLPVATKRTKPSAGNAEPTQPTVDEWPPPPGAQPAAPATQVSAQTPFAPADRIGDAATGETASGLAADSGDVTKPTSRRGWWLVAGLLCGAVAAALLWHRSSSPRQQTPEPAASANSSTTASLAATSTTASPSQLPRPSASAPLTATDTSPVSTTESSSPKPVAAKPTSPQRTSKPKATTPPAGTNTPPTNTGKKPTPKPDCSNPFYRDANGDLVAKPGCFIK